MQDLGQSLTGLGGMQSLFARRTLLSSSEFHPSPSPLQSQVDALVGGFRSQITDWRALSALTAGGMAYRAGRIGVMGLGNGSLLRAASVGLGLTAEVSTFELTYRSLESLPSSQPGNTSLWSWSGNGGLRQGLYQSFIAFGMLKGVGRLAQGENFVAQHLLQDSAMVLGHQATGALGLTPRPEGSLAQQFLHAEATNLQLGAGMALAHGFAPGMRALEWGMDLSLGNSGTPPPRLFDSEEILAFAGASRSSIFSDARESRTEKIIREASIHAMAKGRGEGDSGGPNPFSSLLSQVARMKDPRSVKIALRLLYVGSNGPLRVEILRTLLAMEEGQAASPLLRSLVRDPRIEETYFLTPEAHARTAVKIAELKRGSPRESATFYFDPKDSPSPVPPTPEPQKIISVTGDEQMRLNILRILELGKLLLKPDTDALPFSAREALAEGLELAKFFERIVRNQRKMVDIDFLTGFYSRGGLERYAPSLEHRLVAFRRHTENHKLPDYVLMIDIDHFKKVNDQYGHPNGDDVLREVAQLIRRSIRMRDVRARYGGEEFFIMLAKAGESGALETAERIRKAVEEEAIEIEGFDPIHVTVSIGAAPLRLIPSPEREGELTHEGSMADAIQRADVALYEAKNLGRNRVRLSTE